MTAQKPESVVALSPVVTVVIAGVLLLMQPAPSVLSPDARLMMMTQGCQHTYQALDAL